MKAWKTKNEVDHFYLKIYQETYQYQKKKTKKMKTLNKEKKK